MWKNVVQPDRSQMTIYLAYVRCLLDNWGYSHTLGKCNTYCFSMASIASNALALLLRLYVHCLACCSLGDKHFSTFEWLPVALCYEPTGDLLSTFK